MHLNKSPLAIIEVPTNRLKTRREKENFFNFFFLTRRLNRGKVVELELELDFYASVFDV